MAYVVAVKWTAQSGAEEQVHAIARQLLAPTRAEPGCQYYAATRDPLDPRVFFFFEVYDDEAAFDSHRASEHIQRLALGEAVPLLASRDRWAYETIDE